LLLTSGRPTKPYSWGRIDLLLTSGRPTKPYSWGRIDLLLKRILVFVDSWMVQQPKLILAISNSMSDVVTTACTVNGTGCVCKTKQINCKYNLFYHYVLCHP
jgi:hypothetical protein